MNNDHKEVFREEAYEHLYDLENSLLELEENPHDTELLGRVFRSMHTIKGSGSMFGFDTLAAFTHEVETVLDFVRTGKVAINKNLINLCLAARDRIKSILDANDHDDDLASTQKLVADLRKLAGSDNHHNDHPAAAANEAKLQAPDITYRIRFKPFSGIFLNGTNPIALLNELRELGKCTIVSQMTNVPPLKELEPECCYLYWDMVLTTNRGKDAILDVFIFVEDDCELKIDIIDDDSNFDEDEDYKKLGEILVERGELSQADMNKVLSKSKRFGELAIESGVANSEQIESALIEQQHVRTVRHERKTEDVTSSIRVPVEKLDVLVNLVGELVTIQARLTQRAIFRDDEEFIAIAEEVERLTIEMRDNTLTIRMLPIGTTFSKFKRLVHDLSQELGKEIELTTSGAETELDKTVIEKLNDPLIHLIRNSIDHAIELPEIRAKAGKPRQGTIHLSAVHSGDSVLIKIKDDGAGLDKQAIRAKAIEKGLISATAELSDQETFNLIFAPGFSTAKKVTNVSGRGVGMDVVKKAIDALRGSISISSTSGTGTTITVKIPLTLAIIESLLVQVGSDFFVMPLNLVNECIELSANDRKDAHGRNLAKIRETIVPYIPLREFFEIPGEQPELQQIVIVNVEERQIGFVVDNVVGEHQTVIKSLGKYYKNVEGVSGATILGDGSVALILDTPLLISLAEKLENS